MLLLFGLAAHEVLMVAIASLGEATVAIKRADRLCANAIVDLTTATAISPAAGETGRRT